MEVNTGVLIVHIPDYIVELRTFYLQPRSFLKSNDFL